MKKILTVILIILNMVIISGYAHAVVKIKDVANVEGIRENKLTGYGLVVGLNGTGDKDQTKFTSQSLANMLERMGITVDKNAVKVKNVAAVMVTATLPPFARAGQTIDVTLSSLGDAKSLEGGTLLLTPLQSANNQVYAVAQGSVSIGGSNVSGGSGNTSKNHPTAGRVPNGAIIEREVPFEMDTTQIQLFFNKYSLADVVSAKSAINTFMGLEVASITSPSNIAINIPNHFQGNYYDFLNNVLNLEIEPETFAKVIMDERTGTIVMGSDVRISTVAIAHGNLTITITDNVQINEPGIFSTAPDAAQEAQQPAVENRDTSRLMMVPEGVTVSDLVKALNAIGVTPRDLMSILQSIKAAGALHASLEVI